MVGKRASWPYRIAAVSLLVLVGVVDLVAKLGPLGGWSAFFDVSVNVVLIAVAITVVVIGERKDRAFDRTELVNAY